MMGQKINVRNIIFQEVNRCALKNTGVVVEPEEDDNEGEECTGEKQTTEQEGEVEKTGSIHVDSEKEDDDVT
ncbi:hypothetical protein J1N35_034797 [Gossypium stocksii]|uniref:Uncharacterized protein n=1 Tax=Gossypium stocksii TaxID=47602 RepID=A0A9D3USR3_9ROSI|nr:hypothetical protein J1N35_034797 [Gossypium stocksii]